MKKVSRIILALYSTIFAIIISIGNIRGLLSGNNILITLVFLPTTIYLTINTARFFIFSLKKKAQNLKASTTDDLLIQSNNEFSPTANSLPRYSFSFKNFLRQQNPAFLITLGLLAIAISATVLRSLIELTNQPQLSLLISYL